MKEELGVLCYWTFGFHLHVDWREHFSHGSVDMNHSWEKSRSRLLHWTTIEHLIASSFLLGATDVNCSWKEPRAELLHCIPIWQLTATSEATGKSVSTPPSSGQWVWTVHANSPSQSCYPSLFQTLDCDLSFSGWWIWRTHESSTGQSCYTLLFQTPNGDLTHSGWLTWKTHDRSSGQSCLTALLSVFIASSRATIRSAFCSRQWIQIAEIRDVTLYRSWILDCDLLFTEVGPRNVP